MNTTSGSLVEPQGPSSPTDRPSGRLTRRTVDAPTRAFHGLMTICFVGAYATAEVESLRLVHVTLGYSVAGLIVARLVWGLMGPKPSRWSSWAARLRPLQRFFQSLNAKDIITLLPALNMLALIVLLLSGLATVASGISLDQAWGGDALEDLLEELHEFAGNAMLVAVIGHLGMVSLSALFKGPSQLIAMATGRVSGPGPDLVRRNRGWLALLLIGAVLGFWAWQWQSSPTAGDGGQGHASTWASGDPQGKQSVHGAHAARHGHHDDDDDD